MKKPSPAFVVACIALFVSLGGTSVAAISYAKRAGAVDGKSAVGAGASLSKAAGKLVATASSGDGKGQLPGRFVADVAEAKAFGSYVQVVDNATGAPTTLGTADGLATLSATCTDENAGPGVADPLTTLTLTNNTGDTINFNSRIGGNGANVVAQAAATVQSVAIRGSNSFEIEGQYRDKDVRFAGAVRQDGRGTADAKCLVYGTMTTVGT